MMTGSVSFFGLIYIRTKRLLGDRIIVGLCYILFYE